MISGPKSAGISSIPPEILVCLKNLPNSQSPPPQGCDVMTSLTHLIFSISNLLIFFRVKDLKQTYYLIIINIT